MNYSAQNSGSQTLAAEAANNIGGSMDGAIDNLVRCADLTNAILSRIHGPHPTAVGEGAPNNMQLSLSGTASTICRRASEVADDLQRILAAL